MSSTAEASFLVRQLALPAPAGDTTKAAISRAHRALKKWTWNRVRDVWHGDARIRISADELDQLRNLVRERKYSWRLNGAAWDGTLGFIERIAAIEAELRDLRALISRLPDKSIGRPPLDVGGAAQGHGAAPFRPGKQDGAEGRGVTPHSLGPVMRGADLMGFDPTNTAGTDTNAIIDYAKPSVPRPKVRKNAMRPRAAFARARSAESKYSKQEL